MSPTSLRRHPAAFEPVTLTLTVPLSLAGAVIGLMLITTLGVAANTAVIGALTAMAAGRSRLPGLSRMRDPHRQNLVQSAVSGATFAAANSLLLPLAVPVALGRPDLVWPLLAGAVVGLAVDSWMLYRVFDSTLLPADAPWPSGIAAAETIEAGDQGGRKARVLGLAALVGLAGALVKMPMGAAGVAFLGTPWALLMFAAGLLVAQYAPGLLGTDLAAHHVPHGVMIGAGCVALFQTLRLLRRDNGRTVPPSDSPEPSGTDDDRFRPDRRTVGAPELRRSLMRGGLLFLLGAALVGLTGGIGVRMGWTGLVAWSLFAGFAALVHQLIVGLTAMYSGWFPAFALTLVFMIAGLLLGIPAEPLALLVGYVASTGPAFADMGFDLKAGWLLRKDAVPWQPYEKAGRRQQYRAQLVGFAVAVLVVAVSWPVFLADGRVPPVARVYADTITTGLTDTGALTQMALWAVPGALVQALGGHERQMGLLLATGLLVSIPVAGWFILAVLVIRLAARHRRRRKDGAEDTFALVGAGLVAGSSVHDVTQVYRDL
jgi:uncharacterized oligopeptide transporter (OPT) family protein